MGGKLESEPRNREFAGSRKTETESKNVLEEDFFIFGRRQNNCFKSKPNEGNHSQHGLKSTLAKQIHRDDSTERIILKISNVLTNLIAFSLV